MTASLDGLTERLCPPSRSGDLKLRRSATARPCLYSRIPADGQQLAVVARSESRPRFGGCCDFDVLDLEVSDADRGGSSARCSSGAVHEGKAAGCRFARRVAHPRVCCSLHPVAYMLRYRLTIALWALSGRMLPLIISAVWSGSERPVLGLSRKGLSRYFLSAFVVRQFHDCWLVMSFEKTQLQAALAPIGSSAATPLPLSAFPPLRAGTRCAVLVADHGDPSFCLQPPPSACPARRSWLAVVRHPPGFSCLRFCFRPVITMLCFWTEPPLH